MSGAVSQATGSSGVPLWSIVNGQAAYSTDGGVTWTVVTGPTTIPNATPSAAGLMSAAQATNIQGGAVTGTWVTPTVDLTATSITAFTMPTAAGKKFYMVQSRLVVLTRDASLTTGLTWNFAQNGSSVSNSVATSTSSLNTASAGAPQSLSAAPTNVQIIAMDTNVMQAQITVGVAGSGLTTCTGFWALVGYYA